MVQVTISVGGSTFAHDFPEVPTVGSIVSIQFKDEGPPRQSDRQKGAMATRASWSIRCSECRIVT